jgi:myo-inositol 2-dehydrogenase/D-chiro-inositol 1-dehydrogenase
MGSDRPPLGVAVIGAGRMGRVHLDALEHARGASVLAVVDPVQSTREELAQRGHRVYAEVDGLLSSEHPEAALIAAPSDLHVTLVRTFAAHGIPLLCEKPVGVRVDDAIEALAAVTRAGVLMQVGYWRRFVPALQALRARIADGQLGEISLIACHQWDEHPPSAEFRAHSGGIAVDMAVHELDQARWLTGREVAWVAAASGTAGGSAAASGTANTPAGDPDVAAILAQLSGGVSAAISLGRRFAHGDCCWIEVFGTDGYERIEFMWGAEGGRVFRAAVLAQLEAFADAVRGEQQLGAGGEDAIAALAAAQLAGEALRRGHSQETAATVPVAW